MNGATSPPPAAAPAGPTPAGAPATGGAPDPVLELVRLLPDLAITLYEAAHKDRAPAAGTTLTATQMRALIFLTHRQGVTMGALADALGIGRAATTELVSRLEDKGLVRREHGAADRRVVVVRLAAEAESYTDAMLSVCREHMADALRQFPDIDPVRLADLLRTLMQHWRKADTP